MQIIKLNAIDSTNRYLYDLAAKVALEDYAAVMAQYQTHGRGQRGASWKSERGKNLIISVLKINLATLVQDQFYLNMRMSLAVFKTLKHFNLPQLSVKWPNDILSGNKKISGVLIELSTKTNKINKAIIGVGINVNQTYFENLPRASSMKMLMGESYNIDDLAVLLVKNIQFYFEHYEDASIKAAYESVLFRRYKPSTFLDHNNDKFTGIIKGVSTDGRLMVQTELSERLFDLKTISLLY